MADSRMFSDIPVEIGVVFEGERIRKQTMHAELGGPSIGEKFELVRVRPAGEVDDGRVILIGPDLDGMEPGSSHPFGCLVDVTGPVLERDMESVMERRVHDFWNWIEGCMHLNQRNAIWIRVDRKSVSKGLRLGHIGTAICRLFKSAMPIIEGISVTFLTDLAAVAEVYPEAVARYEERDARTRGMTDEDVEVFYGCSLCQSFAPTHVCVITPQRYANCGAISWLDGRAAARVDPKGPIYEIGKGSCLDPESGEYEGVNRVVKEKSLGDVQRVQLYSAFGYPHTSCGCFECTTFYVPECDGLGIVHRDFRGSTPTGLTFGTIAESTGGGRQVDGFHGLSFEYMRSSRFLRASGGWDRIVWMPSEVKERLAGVIPGDLAPCIATEKDVNTVNELVAFLTAHRHPNLARVVSTAAAMVEDLSDTEPGAGNVSGEGIPDHAVTISFRNVSLRADRVHVRRR